MKNSMSRRQFILAAGVVAGSAVLAGCGGSASPSSGAADTGGSGASSSAKGSPDDAYTLVTDGTITCIAEMGFMPFEYLDGDTPKGFDIDLMAAVAEHMGLTSAWLPSQAFDTLVPTIKQGGKADVACSGITINDDRLESVDFSDPYMDSNQALVVKSDSTETEGALNDASKTVACQAGTTGDDWISENLPNAQKVSLQDVAAAMAGVQTGLYDAFVIDLPVASNLISQSYSDLKVAEEIPTGEQYGIAVSKDDPALTAAINKALADMRSDGTMDQLKQTWFGGMI
ncbi:MAG: amino acid ABC transporter substrate-binding protein [Coriobacteriaceae bacterium]|nr:amino acid ABC transporter substrate-binding protein [Coriobacteriaceae bacterium]MDD7583573.1 amino acid ABC transporter substrate-binding protein [Coriobacteriaceae bacterium]